MENLTIHHLVPRQHTKRKQQDPGETVNICSACHRQIHTLFDNKLLAKELNTLEKLSNEPHAKELNTLEKLSNEPQMQKFLAWVRKQDPGKRISVHR